MFRLQDKQVFNLFFHHRHIVSQHDLLHFRTVRFKEDYDTWLLHYMEENLLYLALISFRQLHSAVIRYKCMHITLFCIFPPLFWFFERIYFVPAGGPLFVEGDDDSSECSFRLQSSASSLNISDFFAHACPPPEVA